MSIHAEDDLELSESASVKAARDRSDDSSNNNASATRSTVTDAPLVVTEDTCSSTLWLRRAEPIGLPDGLVVCPLGLGEAGRVFLGPENNSRGRQQSVP
ncbi:hypothetical protein SKAU_G00095680 [Synaphobranchus kaupii]|uniref:Uncharacterized protein n=1 Tax=Synaphobranchus kaupii TaxID=118154 RepID=A0A9Q1J4S3_SYNKA|nr:hypothetical protein SKAU_G00095680 [Synaphobranchus kaupii]